ncbi:MAG: hypothetical protein MZV64_62795 [Ignavibacteriales bacterium]|nr:hypothetical protein [Ignavibacteriales bacterium]
MRRARSWNCTSSAARSSKPTSFPQRRNEILPFSCFSIGRSAVHGDGRARDRGSAQHRTG